MTDLKSPDEIKLMAEGGKICAMALKEALKHVKSGVKTIELDKIVDKFISKNKAEASFKKVKGYHFATCINLNEGLVHGIPNNRIIKSGDLVKIDLGVFYKGFNTDLSHTIEVETNKESAFLSTGNNALMSAIDQCHFGNRVGDISNAIQKVIEGGGYTISRDLVGHAVGRLLHEDPLVPGYGFKKTGPLLKDGMVLALEVIYQKGRWEIAYEDDGWTIFTKDKSLAGLFEHTVAITPQGPIVLTNLA